MVTTPITVPLQWQQIGWQGPGSAPSKLGIYVALGGSTTPQLFEFDTGGAGFYPTFAATAPWWGSDWQATGYTFKQDYDGGQITYKGDVVSTSLSFFAGPGPGQPLLTVPGVIVGQTTAINDAPIDPTAKDPPLEKAFWGDFGMAPKQGKAGKDDHQSLPGPAPTLDSLAAQLTYGAGVTPGFRVHASAQAPWVQIGLWPSDLALLPTSFRLNPAVGSSAAGIPYYAESVVTATLAVSDGTTSFSNAATGLIFDTGAYATIHNHKGPFPAALISGGSVLSGAGVQLSAPSLQPSGLGVSVPFLDFNAGDTVNQDLVWVKDEADYYLNTGLLPFLANDLIFALGYDSSQGQLTLVPQPAPEPLTGSGLAVAAALSGRLRRLRRRIRERDGRV